MTFNEYLTGKKIDAELFAMADPVTYAEWAGLYMQMNAGSFTVQKKFLLNTIRRKYLLR